MVRSGLFVLVALLWSAGLGAEQTLALVIGNESYTADRPASAVADAQRLGRRLEALGVQVTVASEVRAHEWAGLIERFSQRAESAHLALVVYAGHALQLGETAYLVPVGIDLRSRSDLNKLTPLQSLIAATAKARHAVVVLDTCYRSSLAAGWGEGTFAKRPVCAGEVSAQPLSERLSLVFAGQDPISPDRRGKGVVWQLASRLGSPGDDVVEWLRTSVRAAGNEQAAVAHGRVNAADLPWMADESASADEPPSMAQSPESSPTVPREGSTQEEPLVIAGRRGGSGSDPSAPPPADGPADGPVPDSSPNEPLPARDGVQRVALTVRTDPADARVRILNIEPRYRDGIELAPGESYHIEASHPDHATVTRWVGLGDDARVVNLVLAPIEPPDQPVAANETAEVPDRTREPPDAQADETEGAGEAIDPEERERRDRSLALERFADLVQAIESGDSARVGDLLVPGPKRALFTGLIATYPTIEVELLDLRRSPGDDRRFDVDLTIRELATADGLQVTPADAFRSTMLSSRMLDPSGSHWTSVF